MERLVLRRKFLKYTFQPYWVFNQERWAVEPKPLVLDNLRYNVHCVLFVVLYLQGQFSIYILRITEHTITMTKTIRSHNSRTPLI